MSSVNIYICKKKQQHSYQKKNNLGRFFFQRTLHYFLIDSYTSVSLLRQIIFHIFLAMQLFLFFFFGVSMNRLMALKKNLLCVVNEQQAKVNALFNRVTAALILGVGAVPVVSMVVAAGAVRLWMCGCDSRCE